MLGVAPEAGIDEIRARYRALARALHPDRGNRSGDAPSRDDGASADPHLTMAAVNDAWAVLGDPERRRAYDRSLGMGATASHRTPSPSVDHGHGLRAVPAHPEPIGCIPALARGLPWAVLLALLATIFVFTAYAGRGRDADDPTTTPPTVAVADLRGSCIQATAGVVLVVDCLTAGHEGVIVAQAAIGASCPAGTDEWVVRQRGVLACTEPGSGDAE